MKHRIGVNTGAVAGLVMSFAAEAADLGRVPVYSPPLPIVPSWTGCYAGLNVGGSWAQASLSDPILSSSFGSISRGGLAGAGQLGCDFQAGPVVLGFQGMADAMNITASGLQPNGFVTNTFKVAWIETLTARLGVLVQPSTLLYAKGGAAWLQGNVAMTIPGLSISTGNTTLGGWTVGGGFEFMFAPNWSAFVEYGYQGFGTNQAAFAGSGGAFPLNFNLNVNTQTVLIGVNFRFGDPLAPNY
jgi:outer membrane immunogenic protein